MGVERVPLGEAIGRRASTDIVSTEALPEYVRSTVDGYAVKAANTYGATDSVPSMLNLRGKVEMGVVDGRKIAAGEAIYVPTGGAVPEGADAMVMLEHTEVFLHNLAVYKPASVGDNLIRIGDDVAVGDVVIERGQRVTPMKAGLLAALGFAEIEAFKPLKVAVISTGDEIVTIDGKTQIGQIRDTNTTINSALCRDSGFEVVSEVRIGDGFGLLDAAVKSAVSVADVVLVSGGSSIGTRDFTEQVLESQGKILVHGIALKPGKPTLIADVCGKAVCGLPGHPMACLLTLKLLVIGAVTELFGDGEAPFVFAETTINFPSSPGRLTVQPVTLEYKENGVLATPLFYKSGMVSALAKADGYALIPSEAEGVTNGQRLKIYLL